MKKHISIKVKHMLLIITVLFILVFSKSIYWKGIYVYNQIVPEALAITTLKINTYTLKNENKRLEALILNNDYSIFQPIYISQNGLRLQYNRISPRDAKRVYETFLAFMEKYNLYETQADYVLHVALIQWFSGDGDLAQSLLEPFDELPHFDNSDVTLVKAAMAISLMDYQSALDLLSSVPEAHYPKEVNDMLSYVSTLTNRSVEQVPSQYNTKKKAKYSSLFKGFSEMNASIASWKTNLELKSHSTSSHHLTGTITLDGLPLEGVLVTTSSSKGISSHYSDMPFSITDSEGHYQLSNIEESTQQIILIMPYHAIAQAQLPSMYYLDPLAYTRLPLAFHTMPKFTSLYIKDHTLYYAFEDPLYSDEKAYFITVKHTDPSYNIYHQLSVELPKGTKGAIPIDAFFENNYTNFSLDNPNKDYLPPLYLSGDYAFSIGVMAGDQPMSIGYFDTQKINIVPFTGRDKPSKGDLLMEKGRLDEAIQAYELEDSLHAYNMLIFIYTETAPHRAIEWVYQKHLRFQTPSRPTWLKIAELYKRIGDTEAELMYLSKSIDASSPSYVHANYVSALARAGSFSQAMVYFEENLLKTQEQTWLSSLLVIGNRQDLMTKNMQTLYQALPSLDAYSPFFVAINEGNYPLALSWLQTGPNEDLNTLFDLIYHDLWGPKDSETFMSSYIDAVEGMQTASVKSIAKAIKENHNWFH